MQKIWFFLAVALVGCASEPVSPPRLAPDGRPLKPNERLVKIESVPSGARVYFATGANEPTAISGLGYIGTTPFEFVCEAENDGTFTCKSAFFLYSSFVPKVAIFEAKLDGKTNVVRRIFHGNSMHTGGDKVPNGLFFEFNP